MTTESTAVVSCVHCGATVADPNETGALCSACKEDQAILRRGWRKYVPPLAAPGAIAVVAGLCFHITLAVNGREVDLVALPCGLIAVVSGWAGAAQARRERSRTFVAAVAVIAIGLYLVVWRSGVLTWI